MKIIQPSVIIFLALAGVTAVLFAQSPPASSDGDPFLKKPALPVRTSGQEMPPDPVTIYFTVEVYALPKVGASKLLGENRDGEARHKAVLELASKGNARLETLLGSVCKIGQQSQILQVIQVPYPTDFEPWGKKGAFPAAYEVRNTGETLEYEPKLSADARTCDMQMKLWSVSLKGFLHYGFKFKDAGDGKPAQLETGQAVPHNAPDDSFLSQPVFSTGTLTTTVSMPVSLPQFLGTLNDGGGQMPGEPAREKPVRLVFGRISLMNVKRAAATGEIASGHQLSVYSMSREAAQKILAADPQPGAYYDAVQALIKKGEAKNESLMVLNGQQSIVEQGVGDVRYAREYALNPGDSKPTPTLFETERTGNSWQIEHALGPGRAGPWVDMSMLAMIARPTVVLHPEGVAKIFQGPPVLEKRSISTSFAANLDEETFAGTLTPPGDTGVPGVKDAGRVWLAFVRTTLAK